MKNEEVAKLGICSGAVNLVQSAKDSPWHRFTSGKSHRRVNALLMVYYHLNKPTNKNWQVVILFQLVLSRNE